MTHYASCCVCALSGTAFPASVVSLETLGSYKCGSAFCHYHVPEGLPVKKIDEAPDVAQAAESQYELTKAFTRIADALDRLATIEQKKFDIAHPPEQPKREATIIRPDDDKRDQFSDKPTTEWLSETEAATPQGKSRFQARFEDPQAGNSERADKEERRARKAKRKPRIDRAMPQDK